VVEHSGGAIGGVSLEALAAGQRLDARVSAALLGENVEALAGKLAGCKLDRVWLVEHAHLSVYTADGYTAALEALIRRERPELVLFPHTYQVRDYAPKLAARFGRPLVSDVVGFRPGESAHVFVRQLFQGRLNADVCVRELGPHFISLQAGACRASDVEQGSALIERFTPDIPAPRTRPEPPFRESGGTVDLTTASVIVAVGRGIKEKENLELAASLAGALGGELAASRPVCDNGWLPIERQVGSSGQTVAPKLYVAIGVSGAIQHLVGMKGSKTVVAINKDEDAPIFEVADYGIVGDLFEIVPALIDEIRKAKG
jgi:electron transfer flavoprotein alpha subunit